ncbi:hypothetical protein JMUB6875_15010 [Nocardia sp. JMUB6875]|uniref:hypothetical protein n=1 Tax=Nocardia sp. JMUB6875 TaxID=3158170 RepID=UPI0032E79987
MAALLVLQALLFVTSVAVIDLDRPDFPLRAFLITTAVSAVTAALLYPRSSGLRHAVAKAALVTTGAWCAATVFDMLLYSEAGIVW